MRKIQGPAFVAAPLLTLSLAFAQAPTTQPSSSRAPVRPSPATTSSTNAANPLDQADLTAFFDGILPLQLERSDIGGAAVMVMKDGNILLEKGYGYADVRRGKPVDPAATIFRLASISKLFTWISIMQLEEQGKVDLDTDVNQYLDFRIRPAFNKPITLRNLMTHTAGFEDTFDDVIIFDSKKTITLRDYLLHNQPTRIFPPGEIPAYSNYGVGLASYIVQRVSGEPFAQYVHEHIFAPLGMTHSSFYQPLEKPLAGLQSRGYLHKTTSPPVGFEFWSPLGSGAASSSAGDMGRFGQALLNGGELDGKRILKPETLALMWTPQFSASDQLPPICMGFYQSWRNHLRWIGHTGDLIDFHSLFFVEPTQKIVLFVSYNSAGASALARPEILRFFSDRYFPGAPAVQYLNLPAKDLKDIEGTYQSTRRAETTKFKLSTLFSQRSTTVNKEGELILSHSRDLRDHPIKWKPIGKDLWQAEGEQQRIFAVRDKNNNIVRLAFDFPAAQLERVPWYENESWILIAFSCSFGILALIILTNLLRAWKHLIHRGRPMPEPQPRTMGLPAASRFAAYLWIALLAALFDYFIRANDNLMLPSPAWFKWMALENFAAMLAIVLSTLTVIAGVESWSKDLRFLTKLKFSLVALACLFMSWFAIHWHIIGPTHRI